MRKVPQRPLRTQIALGFLGVLALVVQAGCLTSENRARFFTYCDGTGCYRCDERGCGLLDGRPPGAACARASDCAPGCYCTAGGICAEAGFCDRNADCGSTYVCNVARHSCEPAPVGTGGMPVPEVKPSACKVETDCAAGAECRDGVCKAAPIVPNHCVFSRECGKGGVCVNGACQKACADDASCGTGRACTDGRCQPKAMGVACTRSAECGAGQTCINGVCHMGCAKDAECQAANKNDMCLAGLCRPDERRVPECKMNAECAAGRECVNALCRDFCYAASDCKGCADGSSVCHAGYCMTEKEINPGCRLGTECGPAARKCIDGTCVK